MTVRLPEDLERFIRDEVKNGRFASEDEAVTEAVRLLSKQDSRGKTLPILPPGYKPIWEVAQEITADIPPEEWAKVPVDSSEQLDHYIYGTPRRPPSP